MPKQYPRAHRVADVLKSELSKQVTLDFKDKISGLVTITAVDISRDLRNATVFVTILPDEQITSSVDTLNESAVFLRTQLSQRLEMRAIPKLKFVYDASYATGSRVSKLIDDIND